MSSLPRGAIVDHYFIDEVVTQGGFAWAYFVRSTQEPNGPQYFMKELFPDKIAARVGQEVQLAKPSLQPQWESCQRGFERELNVLSDISSVANVNVPKLVDAFAANNTLYIVQEKITGITMDHWFRAHVRKMGAERNSALMECLTELLYTLDVLHRMHKLHRDIKPSNVIIDEHGRPFLVDFGAVRLEIDTKTMNIQDRAVTPGFASLEQTNPDGQLEQGAYSDLYSLAATFYILMFNEKPPEVVARSLGNRVAQEFITLSDQYDTAFLQTLERAYELLPADRYRSASDWLSDLAPIAKRWNVNVHQERAELSYKFEVGKAAGNDPTIHRLVIKQSQWMSRNHLLVNLLTKPDGSMNLTLTDTSSNGTSLVRHVPGQGQVSEPLVRNVPVSFAYQSDIVVKMADVSLTLSQLLLSFAEETKAGQIIKAIEQADTGTRTRIMDGYEGGLADNLDEALHPEANGINWGFRLFSFEGRITRAVFWQSFGLIVGVGILFNLAITLLVMQSSSSSDAGTIELILSVPAGLFTMWMLAAVYAKRMRDAGIANPVFGILLVLAMIPILNLVALIIAGTQDTDESVVI